METPKRPFDAIEFKRQAQMRIHDEVHGKTHAELIEYFRERAEKGPLGDWWSTIARAQARTDTPKGAERGSAPRG